MNHLENIRLSLDDIGEALKKLSDGKSSESQSVKDFYEKVTASFPDIKFEFRESLWDEDLDVEETYRPLWWDELDEPFELDEFHWMIQIQKMDLINPTEAIELMTSIEAGVLAEASLNGEYLPEYAQEFGRQKLEKVIEIGKKANEEMILRNLKLVLHVARKYSRRVHIEDAFSFGVFGLIQAVKKFDWRLGHQFSTYATWWLRQSLTREIANSNTTIDIPVHAVERVNSYKWELREYLQNEFTSAGDVSIQDKSGQISIVIPGVPTLRFESEMDATLICALEASAPALEFWDVFNEARWLIEDYELFDSSKSNVEYKGIAEDLATRLTDFVLSEKEIEVLFSRHGVVNGEPQTLEEIGQRFGVTRERVRQIEKKAIMKLNVFLEGVTIDNYWDKIESSVLAYEKRIEEDASLKFPTVKRNDCGNEAGYEQHRIKYEEPCNDCKRAHRNKTRAPRKVQHATKKQKKEHVSRGHNNEILIATNKERSLRAASMQVEAVKWALEVLEGRDLSNSMLQAAQTRLQHPEASLLELAGLIGNSVTKDMVAGQLRRLLRLAEDQVRNQTH